MGMRSDDTHQSAEKAMPKRAAGLSARTVQTIKTPGMHADGHGLYLQVTASGAKTWIFRYSPDGKRRREMGLGSTSLYGLAEARQKAQDARRLVAEGIDPIEARKRQNEAQRAGGGDERQSCHGSVGDGQARVTGFSRPHDGLSEQRVSPHVFACPSLDARRHKNLRSGGDFV